MTPTGSLAIGRSLSAVVVTLHGDLDLIASLRLAAALRDLIEGQGNLAVIVDLRDVRRIDGSGSDVLAAAAERIAGRGGELRLGGPTSAVFDVLVPAGLARFVSAPFEQVHRPWSLGRHNTGASRLAGIKAHPAGGGRHHHYDKGGRT